VRPKQHRGTPPARHDPGSAARPTPLSGATTLSPPPDPTGSAPIGLAIAIAVLFLARLVDWMTSDVWFDEALTINGHVVNRTLREVVTQYPAANHHVLFSVILWLWVRAIEPYLGEWLMRVPCALFAATMVVLPLLHWRRWLGQRAAIACSLTLAASLIVAGFGWQLRGYSLSMLLGALATGGVMELIDGSRRRGLILCLPAALMLPLVIPTNVLLLAALGATLIWARPRSVPWRLWILRTLLPIAATTALGSAYYLTVWTDFRRVLAHAEGWPSVVAVARAWMVAAVAHFGPVLLPFAWCHRWLRSARTTSAPQRETSAAAVADITLAWKFLAPILVFCALLLVFMRPAPFPRTFLVCLPTATFAVFLACRGSVVWSRVSPALVAGAMALNGLTWQYATDRVTADELRHGEHAQDLVKEYYRGRHDVSAVTEALVANNLGERLVLLTGFHEFPATQFYWGREHLPVARVLVAWGQGARDWQAKAGPDATLAVQAFSEKHAAQILRDGGVTHKGDTPRLTLLIRTSGLSIWTIDAPRGATTSSAPVP
jgi:hypothetical protein